MSFLVYICSQEVQLEMALEFMIALLTSCSLRLLFELVHLRINRDMIRVGNETDQEIICLSD